MKNTEISKILKKTFARPKSRLKKALKRKEYRAFGYCGPSFVNKGAGGEDR